MTIVVLLSAAYLFSYQLDGNNANLKISVNNCVNNYTLYNIVNFDLNPFGEIYSETVIRISFIIIYLVTVVIKYALILQLLLIKCSLRIA